MLPGPAHVRYPTDLSLGADAPLDHLAMIRGGVKRSRGPIPYAALQSPGVYPPKAVAGREGSRDRAIDARRVTRTRLLLLDRRLGFDAETSLGLGQSTAWVPSLQAGPSEERCSALLRLDARPTGIGNTG